MDICRSGEGVGFQPKLARQTDRLETRFRPPVDFLTGAVQLAMVNSAQRDREFVADLKAETAGLRKPQMMGVAPVLGFENREKKSPENKPIRRMSRRT